MQNTHKRAHSEAKAPSKSKKTRESATVRQRAAIETERAIQAATSSLLTISTLHKCHRANCPNFGRICVDPGYGCGRCAVRRAVTGNAV